MGNLPHETKTTVSIGPLLKSLRPLTVTAPDPDADDVALAISHIFANQLTDVQACIFLHDLFITRLDQRPDILAKSASAMRAAAAPINLLELEQIVQGRTQRIGNYNGGLCDIVGTGGDGYSTFNISTASSILASSLLYIAKHGNRASTSKSGSADVLESMGFHAANGDQDESDGGPRLRVVLDSVTPQTLSRIYAKTNYAFLYAHTFHPWVKNAAHIRRQLDHPTIFNLVGPLANPVHALLEARVVGVRKKDLVPVFVEALRLKGVRKAMVVCGDEDLDEISCAGPTHCAQLVEKGRRRGRVIANGDTDSDASGSGSASAEIGIEFFTLHPTDFGLPAHPLNTVSPGLTAAENAAIMHKLLAGELAPDNPILHFVLMNTAALFVVSGVCDDPADGAVGAEDAFGSGDGGEYEGGQGFIKEEGPGGGRWKEGVRLARLAISSGRAVEALKAFMEVTNEVAP